MFQKPKPIKPGPGQESVWDYPRPPRLEDMDKHIKVVFNGTVVAETVRAKRVLETSHPPGIYIPPEDVRGEFLIPRFSTTFCEWKGTARYYGLAVGEQIVDVAAWYYLEPTPSFKELAGYISFYPGQVDACFVDGEKVIPQPGNFYGGWITSDVVGPFKGEPGTNFW
jgi:uncharacterized protein (DUF427 family)